MNEMRQKFKIKMVTHTNTLNKSDQKMLRAAIFSLHFGHVCTGTLSILHTKIRSVLILANEYLYSMTGAYARKIPLIFHHEKCILRFRRRQT